MSLNINHTPTQSTFTFPAQALLGKLVIWTNREGEMMEGIIEGVALSGDGSVQVVTLDEERWVVK
jgi:hypothetical protein